MISESKAFAVSADSALSPSQEPNPLGLVEVLDRPCEQGHHGQTAEQLKEDVGVLRRGGRARRTWLCCVSHLNVESIEQHAA